jgi:hypothetical protein
VVAEIEYGIAKSVRQEHNRRVFDTLLAGFPIAPFDTAAARQYGPIRSQLEKRGQLIGPYDLMIAAHAQALGAVLITDNVGEFVVVGINQRELIDPAQINVEHPLTLSPSPASGGGVRGSAGEGCIYTLSGQINNWVLRTCHSVKPDAVIPANAGIQFPRFAFLSPVAGTATGAFAPIHHVRCDRQHGLV